MTAKTTLTRGACETCGRLKEDLAVPLGDGRCHRTFDASGDVDGATADDCMAYARKYGRARDAALDEVEAAASKRLGEHAEGKVVARHRKDYLVEEWFAEERWRWRVSKRGGFCIACASGGFRSHEECTSNLFQTTGWLPDSVHPGRRSQG